ncbi:MAG: hypothetical protein KGM17_03690 [Sphingomonadales bacterium]|nr:hypothetical protein [Sphingomonadales bacterium]
MKRVRSCPPSGLRAGAALALLAAAAQGGAACGAAGTAANAGPFLQDMLSRGIASVRGWPDNAIASPVQSVQFNAAQPCRLLLVARNGHKFDIALDKAVSVRVETRPRANADAIAITGGTAPYDSVSVFVDDAETLGRVGAAFSAMQASCDKSRTIGF